MAEYDWLIVTVSKSSSTSRILIDVEAFRAYDVSQWTYAYLEWWIKLPDVMRAKLVSELDEAEMIGEFHHQNVGDGF